MDTRAAGRTRLAAVALSTFALSAGSLLPASAAPPSFTYDALGDSFAAGFGVDPSQAYPQVLDGRMRIALDDVAAVPQGGTIQHLLANQLSVLGPETDLVTVSIGGNDLPWISVVAACGISDATECGRWLGLAGAAITDALPAGLDAAYTGVRASAAEAHVVVTGYPRLFSPEYGDYAGTVNIPPFGPIPFEVTVEEQQAMNDLADDLNALIADRAAAHGFQFVDVTARFAGHGVNSPDNWIGTLDSAGPLHPTVEGQHEYGVALRSQINPNSLRR